MSSNNSIRIVDVDFYMASPLNGLDVVYSDFRGTYINQVPIIRVFGSTKTGEKICTHVHGVFPYIYIPYSGESDLNAQIYQIAVHIDKAINISINQASSNNKHVYKISLVSAYPFYGYHAKQHQFLKIYLYNPLLIRKLSGLLQTDAILGKIYQPHEAHLSFVLQFMIDYNLHGMSTMQVSDIKLRRPTGLVVEENNGYLPEHIKRISSCELEADVLANDIINRLEVATGNLAVNPGIKALWEDEQQRLRNKNEDSQIMSCLTLKNMNAKPATSHLVYRRLLLDRLAALAADNADVRNKHLDTSVYPAETPSTLSAQSASFIESHSQSSYHSVSLDSSLLETTSIDVEMNNTLDGNFLDILEELNEIPDNSLEKDCILSQMTDDNLDEDIFDLSFPMNPTIPVEIREEDMWNTTLENLIPQLDGNDDLTDAENKKSVLSKTTRRESLNTVAGSSKFTQIHHIPPGRDMPLLGNEQGIKNRLYPLIKFKTTVNLKTKLKYILTECIKKKLAKRLLVIPLTRISISKRKYTRHRTKKTLRINEQKYKEASIINALKRGVKPKFCLRYKFAYTLQEFKTKFFKKNTFGIIIQYPCKKKKLFLYKNDDYYPDVYQIRASQKRKLKQQDLNNNNTVNLQSIESGNTNLTLLKVSINMPDQQYSKLIHYPNTYENTLAIPKIENISDENMSKLIESSNPQHLDQALNCLKQKFNNHLEKLKKDFYEIPHTPKSFNQKTEISSSDKLISHSKSGDFEHNENNKFPESNNVAIINEHNMGDGIMKKKLNFYSGNRNESKKKRKIVTHSGSEHVMVTRYKSGKKSQENKIKTCRLCLDGNCDSSSDDEKKAIKKRKLSQKCDSPRYNTLSVLISSQQGAARERPFSKENNSFKTKLTKNIHSKEPLPFDRVKRQLNFCDTTLVEEQILCNLRCNHVDRNNQRNLEINQNLKSSGSSSEDESLLNKSYFKAILSKLGHLETNQVNAISPRRIGSENKSYVSNVELLSKEQIAESSLGKETNSDNDSPLNKSYFKRNFKKLSKSEKYDVESNFVPIEGPSKKNSSLQETQKNIISSSELCQYDQQKNNKSLRNCQSLEEDLFQAPDQNEMNNITIRILSQEESIFSLTLQDENKLFIEPINSDLLMVDKIFKPKRKAPLKNKVNQSLDFYNLPHVINPPPFFSNIEDVTGGIEVGLNIFKILSKTTMHLAEFNTILETFNNIRKIYINNVAKNIKISKNNINKIILSCPKIKDVILAPVKNPPSKETLKNWLISSAQKEKSSEKKLERPKIFIPLSPTGTDDDINRSLTLTPCTQECQKDISKTPKSSPNISKNNNKNGTPKSSIKLRELLLLSQDKINNSCDLTGVSLNSFDSSVKNLQNARALLEHHFLTVLIMEIHVRTRGNLKPDPEYDQICSIFYSILNDFPENDKKPLKSRGAIVLETLPFKPDKMPPLLNGIIDCHITYTSTENELIDKFLELIQYWDPDILAGYEIEMLSWGYLIERASILGYNLIPLLGRINYCKDKFIRDGPQGELKITGRITLDVWRLMRHEIALQSYTFESIAYHILHKRVPFYDFKNLTFWWDHPSHLYRYRTVDFYLFRVDQILELFSKLDLIGRTSELARLFGIQFYEVLSRGSQFRVESMMLRLAKPLNFIPVSPSVQQRAKMKAPEYIPLVLEPESKLYVDPVVVLDFQSLYPSIMIAYNYCFSTCIGKVDRLGKNTPFEFGATQLKVSRKRVEHLVKSDMINFSPCGVGFVKSKVREGIVPRMLKEILETRLMVKNSMKQNKDDAVLKKVLHNRQLGLKLIANVTYGYTSANFSGRMPAVEIGDSVVSKGRETLQRAISLVEKTPEWGAKVVYGDTDSLFILFPGRSKDWAFKVGKEIADVVTKDNPDPVKLKFEKVYQPCILQTKKRYVGYMYESPDQNEPVYEAKGIETVRRDGCPAVSKMLEKCLRLIFETNDVSIIKKYILRQFNKIIAGRISIQDFTFAKEYRGASSYRPGACVPSLELARKWKAEDKRSEPRRGERVPYVIVNGSPGLPIIKLVRSPRELLADPSLRPNVLYYISRVIIPPINRCLSLIGADLHIWFNQMPRKYIQVLPSSSPGKKNTISQYFSTTSCASCGEQTKSGLCFDCCSNRSSTLINLTQKVKKWEQNSHEVNLICHSCTKSKSDISCESLDCPIYYKRVQTGRDLQQSFFVRQLLYSEF